MSLVTPLKRTAIIVRDMERSLQFYRDGLGLNVWVEGRSARDIPALYQLLGMPPCTVRWVILQSEDVDWGMVGLFELTDPAPLDDTHPSVDRANRGEACLVFHTPDVERVHALAREIGLTVLCPPTRLELPQHGVESLEMTLRDPNGVLVNLIQNVKGGSIGISNRFPGLARPTVAGGASPARPKKRPSRPRRRGR
jgi:catechol 2,3-dioxygenase-like lactoylglutathione lyase family enzyme